MDDGNSWGGHYSRSCVTKENAATQVDVMTISDNEACIGGLREIQTIVVTAADTVSGYFYVYLNSHRTKMISSDASAIEVEVALNDLPNVYDVSVTRLQPPMLMTRMSPRSINRYTVDRETLRIVPISLSVCN